MVDDSERLKSYRDTAVKNAQRRTSRTILCYPGNINLTDDILIATKFNAIHPQFLNDPLLLSVIENDTTRHFSDHVLIMEEDRLRLITYIKNQGYSYLNDELINLILYRLDRLYIGTGLVKSILLVKAQFYQTLISQNGLERVMRWFRPKGRDITMFRYILVPINNSLHWTLMVIVNPGLIGTKSSDEPQEEFPCLLYLDSLSHTKKQVEKFAQVIRNWLSKELSSHGRPIPSLDEDDLIVYDLDGMNYVVLLNMFIFYSIRHPDIKYLRIST